MTTGTRVYTPESRRELLTLMTRYRIKDPRKIAPDLPEALTTIVMRALEKDPRNRWQSALEMGDALEQWMYGKGYGPTNEKLARHVLELWPGVDRDKVI
jgi:serine/threonine-protein kinase